MNRRSRAMILWVTVVLVAAYVAGFYLVVLGFRAESNELRLMALRIDDWLYRPVIAVTEKDSFVRKLSQRRVTWLCSGFDSRCKSVE